MCELEALGKSESYSSEVCSLLVTMSGFWSRGVLSVRGCRVVAVADLLTEGLELTAVAALRAPRAPPLALTFLKHSAPQTSLKPWHGPSESQLAFDRSVSFEILLERRCCNDGRCGDSDGSLELLSSCESCSVWDLGPAGLALKWECECEFDFGVFVFGPRGVCPGRELVLDLRGLLITSWWWSWW